MTETGTGIEIMSENESEIAKGIGNVSAIEIVRGIVTKVVTNVVQTKVHIVEMIGHQPTTHAHRITATA